MDTIKTTTTTVAPLLASGSTTDERYTPPWLLARITAFFGTSDWFDPCPASYGKAPAVNGLAIPWRGQVYVNGPYSNLEPWVIKFMTEPFKEGLFLCPLSNAGWYQPLYDCPVVHLRQRISFIAPNGKMGSPLFYSDIAYRGPRPYAFADAFEDLGHITHEAPLGRRWRDEIRARMEASA